jgi:hypothetical protein
MCTLLSLPIGKLTTIEPFSCYFGIPLNSLHLVTWYATCIKACLRPELGYFALRYFTASASVSRCRILLVLLLYSLVSGNAESLNVLGIATLVAAAVAAA